MKNKTKIGKLPDFEYQVKLTTMKERDKCVRRVEKLVRGSLEYRDYIFFLKSKMDFSKCWFFPHMGNDDGNKTRVEVHHEPLTLYEICDIVLQKYLDEGYPINEEYIADEVMELHYRNMVGLIPLSKTLHQLYHSSQKAGNEKFDIPLYAVYGYYAKFIEEYAEFIDDKYYEKIEEKKEKSKTMTVEDFKILVKQFEYLEVEGMDAPEEIETDQNEEIVAA